VVPGKTSTYFKGPFDPRYLVDTGDILIGMDGEFNRARWRGGKALLNQRVSRIVPASRDLDESYLFYFLPAALKAIENVTPFVTVKHLSVTHIRDITIPLPSLTEQRRIAQFLENADVLRAKRRAAIAQLDTMTQSIFLDMFGDPARNPKGWPPMELQDVFAIARGGSPRPIQDFITDAIDGINWIMIGDASESDKYITKTRKRIRPEGASRSRTVKPGDFLLTNSMSFGRPYIMKTSGCIHDGWLVLSPRTTEFEPDYFYTLLGSRAVFAEFERRAPGATVKNLNIDLVRKVVVPVAPGSKQKEFSRAVAAIERAGRAQVASLVELDRLFASLQHRAFRGGL
jgi:type I restriction enzyme S subunit